MAAILKKNLLSLVTVILIGMGWSYAIKDHEPWIIHGKTISSDVTSYYGYLPAYFIYDDLSMHFYEGSEFYRYKTGYLRYDDGRRVEKMTMGVAYFYTPFFLAGHAIAGYLGYPQDGFSTPYEIVLILSGMFYALLGLLLLRLVLLKRFSDLTTAVTLIILALGTNLFEYATYDAAMSHSFSFCAVAAFLFFIDKWQENKTHLLAAAIGLAGGVIMLIRPNNVLVVMVFLLWGVTNFKGLWLRIKELFSNYLHLLVMVIFGLLAVLPQLLYWKEYSGNWIFYSYNKETFYWLEPEIIRGFFSYRKGWLVYSPLMVLSLVGFFFMRKKLAEMQIGIIAFFIPAIYITFSWWCWWYGGSFGARTLVDYYPILALPMAAFISVIMERKIWVRIAFIILIIPFIYLTIFQSWQYRSTILRWDGTTKKAYWTIFLNKNYPENYDELWDESAGYRDAYPQEETTQE